MAEVLDKNILMLMANTSAYTGLMLAALTRGATSGTGRTRWAIRPGAAKRLPNVSGHTYLVSFTPLLADTLLGFAVVGQPVPLLMLITVLTYPFVAPSAVPGTPNHETPSAHRAAPARFASS